MITALCRSVKHRLLEDYVAEKGWTLVETYVDDGYSGTNFERPDFKRMIRDIENGHIDCVVVKDLSRLGRNYAKMGYYTEEYFTDRGVRFIAINDSVDNMRDEENDLAPFKNVLNEWYPRDVSKKIRQVRRKHAQLGYFTGGTPAYGYRKDPDDPHKLIVDERGAAAVVQRIFKQFIACMSARMIAEMLNKEGIDCPRFYHAKYNRGQPPRPKEINAWSSTTIHTLLINEVYIGNMVQGKRRVISYKNKNRRQVPKEDWISVKGTHEPIIDMETWDRVQELKRARRSTGHVLKYKGRDSVGMFTGVLTCADCGSHLVSNYKTNKNGHSYCYYRCSRYNYNGVHTCSQHKIMEDTLIEVVLCDIRKYANLSADEKSTLAQELGERARAQRMEDAAQCKREQRECEHRLEIIAKNTTKLYDDRCAGLLPDTVFGGLLAGYMSEQEELNKRSKELSQKYAGLMETENDVARWVDLISQYVNLEKLDRSIVLNLIDEIVVSEAKMVDGERVQDIRIRYRFVGRMLEEADAAS